MIPLKLLQLTDSLVITTDSYSQSYIIKLCLGINIRFRLLSKTNCKLFLSQNHIKKKPLKLKVFQVFVPVSCIKQKAAL